MLYFTSCPNWQETGLHCRLYPTAHGAAGVPDLADLIAALRERGTS